MRSFASLDLCNQSKSLLRFKRKLKKYDKKCWQRIVNAVYYKSTRHLKAWIAKKCLWKIKNMLTSPCGCVNINKFAAEKQKELMKKIKIRYWHNLKVMLIYKSSLMRTHIENNIVQIFCKCTIHTLQQRQVCCLYGFLIQFSKTIIRTWCKSRKKKAKRESDSLKRA